MEDEIPTKTMMSDCLKTVIDQSPEQFDASKELVTVFFSVESLEDDSNFVGSVIGLEVSDSDGAEKYKIDVKMSKEDAFSFVSDYAAGSRRLNMILSHRDKVIRVDTAQINVVRMIDIDHTTGIATLAIDILS